MQKKILKTGALLLSVILLLSNAGRPPAGRTGAPGEQTCASSGCHLPENSDINGEIVLLGLPDQLTATTTYPLTLQLTSVEGSPVRTGFQLTVLDADGTKTGEISNAGPSSGISESNNRQYIDHRSPALPFDDNNNVLYTFDWTAPADLSKQVTIYIAANFANGNASNSDDQIINTSIDVFAIEAVDMDMDGFSAATDCNDDNAEINPGATEVPNNDVDEDCDGTAQQIDMDMDGFNTIFDCDDNDPAINPLATEIPNNDVDENCDGELGAIDGDMDGFNSIDDCNDDDPAINPDAEEILNNDIDEDCDGIAQQIDMDMDGFNSIDDCDDNDSTRNPGAVEIPNNSIDEDCDGIANFIDEDNDGWDSDADCDDSNPDINPGVEEILDNNVDEDCDGIIGITSNMVDINGLITTLDGRGVQGVKVLLNSQEIATSRVDGSWSATITLGNSNSISYSRNDNPVNGVSALDVVQIKNHILGSVILQSAIQINAGDVNGDERISALDLVQLQNVILGLFDEFPNRDSWGFDPPTRLIDENNVGNRIEATGFKVGDVSGNAEPGN